MAKVLRPIGHEDRLSIVDHLDELRSRLIICAIALGVAFALCFWQNSLLLTALNKPLPASVKTAANHLGGLTKDSVSAARDIEASAALFRQLSVTGKLSLADRATIAAAASKLEAAGQALPQTTPKNVPITIGVGEPFTTTLTVCFYFALLLALPVLLYQAYAFIIPALSPNERRVALPVMLAAPVLFVIGVIFTYIIVLPAAIGFLQGYNSNQFNALVQAKPLYSFEVLTMAAIGLAFQLPLGLLGLRQIGVIDGSTLTKHWRYSVIAIAVIAAAMPGADPVTTGLETLPLVILFVASIFLLKFADRRAAASAAAQARELDSDES
ncbi:MAG: twin-arginine translocase subunit TatC [Solirubrobacteraceae bacterium]